MLNDWWVVKGDKQYQIPAIKSSVVTCVRHPVNWLLFARDQVLIFIIALALSLLVYFLFHWAGGGGLLGFWLLGAISDALDRHTKSREYTLYVQTPQGREEIAKMNDGGYLHVLAGEINKRVARNPASAG